MDELPLVPYMFSPTGEKFYDSTAFANWLDTHKRSGSKSFLGSEDPVAEFVIALIDE